MRRTVEWREKHSRFVTTVMTCIVNLRKLQSAHIATSWRPAYSPALYQRAKLLISFRCQVKIWEGPAEESAWAAVAIGGDCGRVAAQE